MKLNKPRAREGSGRSAAKAREHIPAVGAKPGQLVYRFKFPDGSTGDLAVSDVVRTEAAQRDELRKMLELERAVLSHSEYMRSKVARERARKSAEHSAKARADDAVLLELNILAEWCCSKKLAHNRAALIAPIVGCSEGHVRLVLRRHGI